MFLIKTRGARITKKQINFMARYISDNPELIETGRYRNHEKWNQLTEQLNCSGLGPQKSCQDWRKVQIT